MGTYTFLQKSILYSLTLAVLTGAQAVLPRSATAASDRVVLHTLAGDLVLKLYPDVAPKTVAQILRLVRAGVYDTNHFFWVEPGFIAQVPLPFDRAQPLTAEQSALIQKIPGEFSPELKHHRGVISMSRDPQDPDSAQGAFSILLGNAPQLDGKYTIFGELESGWDVLHVIETVPLAADRHTPTARIEITKAEVVSVQALKKMKLAGAVPLPGSSQRTPVVASGVTSGAPSGVGGASAPSCQPGDSTMGSKPTNPAPTPVISDHPPTMRDQPIQVNDEVLPDGERQKVVLFKDLLIDKIYPSMQGPWKQQDLRMLPTDQSRYVWITGYRAEVLDSRTGEASQEFMCHTNLRVVGAPGAPAEFQRERAQLSISQGQKEVNFPKGFALRVENTPERQMNVMVMVLNNNYQKIRRELNFKSTVRFFDDQIAVERKLIPLAQTSVYTDCLTDPTEAKAGEIVCRPASPPDISQWLDGRHRTGHWLVPPGRQAISHDVTKILNLSSDTTLHYIWMHVHPYAESLELRDETSGKTVWKGYAKNPQDPKLAQILSTDSYSGTDGLPLYKSHRYSLTTVYNNRSGHDVDAMAALWMYVKDKSL